MTTKWNPDVRNKLLAHLRAGAFRMDAARAAGVSKGQLGRWLARGRSELTAGGEPTEFTEFVRAVAEAERLASGDLLTRVIDSPQPRGRSAPVRLARALSPELRRALLDAVADEGARGRRRPA